MVHRYVLNLWMNELLLVPWPMETGCCHGAAEGVVYGLLICHGDRQPNRSLHIFRICHVLSCDIKGRAVID